MSYTANARDTANIEEHYVVEVTIKKVAVERKPGMILSPDSKERVVETVTHIVQKAPQMNTASSLVKQMLDVVTDAAQRATIT